MSWRLRRFVALVALALSLLPIAAWAAIDEKDLLPVDEAFALTAKATEDGRIEFSWKIADGYYLYRHRIKVSATDGAKLGAIAVPNGEPHEDEFFGRVETYRKQLTGHVPVVSAGGSIKDGGSIALKIGYQGCADAGVCYPPQTRTLTVALPAASNAASDTAGTNNTGDGSFAALGAALGGRRPLTPAADAVAGSDPLPLPPEQAFGFEAIADGGDTLLLRFTPARGYYLYRDKTQLKLAADGITLGAPRWPKGVLHRDEHFGNVVVYFNQVEVPLPLRRTKAGAQQVVLTASFQGCQDEGICYPLMTRKISVALPAGTVTATEEIPTASATATSQPDASNDPSAATAVASSSAEAATASPELATTSTQTNAQDAVGAEQAEDVRLAAGLAGDNRWLTLLWFFLGGLGLAFTPCVLPMIPILSGLIAGQGTRLGTSRALWLSFVYVLANALVFTVAGVIAGLVGANLQAAFQTPWVLILFALLFVALALSSFGLYELQLPASLRAKLGNISDKQRGGSMLGVAAMGALSALIVGPCVAPPLAASVLYISQTHDPVLGGTALFLLAMGMGVPLLAFGAAAGRGMPTSGPWMTTVQRVFGFVFLALAAWMLSRILPEPVTLALYGLIALAAAAWAFAGTRHDSERVRWLARFAGLVLAIFGAAQLLGALSGGRDPLQPLAGAPFIGTPGGGAQHRELAFRTIKSTQDLDRELAAAQAAGRPLMFDFYADWCVSCKEMEKYTFTDPAVQSALADFVLLKADVTANDEVDQALMKRFGIIGPPGTLFFADATEKRGLRLVGFEKAEAFVARVQRAHGAK
ncbi:protein-disulfide reductase DsbD [Luteimonas panaciterrae]|uniref:protein-disulfide reductase DsbD n=1 Tax=Luteimonas panaciterrae TaxID=363885 RepID=UPI001CFA7500|nr:protein-disulfide reductase DsbD [Luteimonas panaciterrae]